MTGYIFAMLFYAILNGFPPLNLNFIAFIHCCEVSWTIFKEWSGGFLKNEILYFYVLGEKNIPSIASYPLPHEIDGNLTSSLRQ